MNTNAIPTRMSALARTLPQRILLVDDDELDLTLIGDRLRSAGFAVAWAQNGQEALGLLERQWYPLTITDWQMPVMDGVAFTETLRSRGAEDTYVIMLTNRARGVDYERGYVSGVDDYLTKKAADAELLATIHRGFDTLAMRRSLQQAGATQPGLDAETYALCTAAALARLRSEVRRAHRYDRQLTVVTVGIHVAGLPDALPETAVLRECVRTLDHIIRGEVDWIGRLKSEHGAVFAIVLPETGIAAATSVVIPRLLRALNRFAITVPGLPLKLTVGSAGLDHAGAPVEACEAAGLLATAERCRKCQRTRGEQLATVQQSMVAHAEIACRQGYVVQGTCTLKPEAAAIAAPAMSSHPLAARRGRPRTR